MVSHASRRRASHFLLSRGYSRNLSCRVVTLSRSSSRKEPAERRPELAAAVVKEAQENPRYGYRRVHAVLLCKGLRVNLKAVHRIWRIEGLTLSTRKKRKVHASDRSAAPTAPNQVWSMDFAHDRLENGRQVRILGVLDAYTRECLCLKAAPSLSAAAVAKELGWLFLIHGRPTSIRSDNGPEFRASLLAKRLEPHQVRQEFIEPGSPWQNGHIESFFGKLRDELLSCELFTCGEEVQTRLCEFQDHYNTYRPHSGLGGLTPARFRKELLTQSSRKEEEIVTI
jgi:putative transposase